MKKHTGGSAKRIPEHNHPPILITTDDPLVLFSVSHTLRCEGFGQAEILPDPRFTADMLEKKEYGAVLLDLSMPPGSGMEVLDTLLQKVRHPPLIVIYEESESCNRLRIREDSTVHYLLKPFSKADLISIVRSVMEKRIGPG